MASIQYPKLNTRNNDKVYALNQLTKNNQNVDHQIFIVLPKYGVTRLKKEKNRNRKQMSISINQTY